MASSTDAVVGKDLSAKMISSSASAAYWSLFAVAASAAVEENAAGFSCRQ